MNGRFGFLKSSRTHTESEHDSHFLPVVSGIHLGLLGLGSETLKLSDSYEYMRRPYAKHIDTIL